VGSTPAQPPSNDAARRHRVDFGDAFGLACSTTVEATSTDWIVVILSREDLTAPVQEHLNIKPNIIIQ
jgi:hypothetical protein